MANGRTVSNSDAQWIAEKDMRTLMEATQIKDDPKRYKAAKAAAKRKLEEMEAAFSDDDDDDSKDE